MKRLFLVTTALFYLSAASAQETTGKRNRMSNDVIEKFQVLKSDKSIKQGLYQAIYRDNKIIASGAYENNLKTGVWHFYDAKGVVIQNYDFTNKKLLQEAPEDTTSDLRYFVDKELTEKDHTTKPVKIGGRFYGYIPYLRLFKLPNELININRNVSYAIVELLVSPLGRLASYKTTIYSGDYQKVFNMNLNALEDEDKTFIPATVNGEPIGCRIMIKCYITDLGIDFF